VQPVDPLAHDCQPGRIAFPHNVAQRGTSWHIASVAMPQQSIMPSAFASMHSGVQSIRHQLVQALDSDRQMLAKAALTAASDFWATLTL
jgi:hypothetical protein